MARSSVIQAFLMKVCGLLGEISRVTVSRDGAMGRLAVIHQAATLANRGFRSSLHVGEMLASVVKGQGEFSDGWFGPSSYAGETDHFEV